MGERISGQAGTDVTGVPSKADLDAVHAAVRGILSGARERAYRAVGSVMVEAYWRVGQVLVEREQGGKPRAEYGDALLDGLSTRLTQEFGRGFDSSNLRYMRLFYAAFAIRDAVRHESAEGTTRAVDLPEVRPELSWTHYRHLLKVERADVRRFYVEECVANRWSTRQLERQIGSLYFERLLASQDRDAVRSEIQTLEPGPTARDLIKDPYVLEFLGLRENRDYLERDLEQALIDQLREFLLELGRGFSFVARQQRITIDGDHYYVDLVFYNYLLKCFVLVDLKAGKLAHGDLGQMDFYVRYYEKEVRQSDDNPTIGLILCAEKNEAMARYTLLENSRSIFASKYRLVLPSEDELRAELERDRRVLEERCRLPSQPEGGD